ncbi:VOC family protein [Undibacterium arcticum]|uniref:VOC family protein n=1 Tax=Undibacterium arcticum TaxID=1762892 RepID=A0ABV7F2L4_9BURK
MLDHMTFRVADIDTCKAFYEKVLAPLGYGAALEFEHDGVRMLGFSDAGKYDTWFVQVTPVSGPAHIAWRAKSRAAVDAFHAAALAAGGRDNGAPGLREHYHQHYYGAYVLDPDGNNVEAVCHDPA